MADFQNNCGCPAQPIPAQGVEAALVRNPDLQKTVASWHDQGANLQLLALLEVPGPMSP